MPGLSRRGLHTQPLSSSYNGLVYGGDAQSSLWARSNTGDVSFSQLHKFWSVLPPTARRELLRIDKQALFEQVRKNLYCSRCHGLLVEGFSQIVMYGKSLYADGQKLNGNNNSDGHVLSIHDDVRDPSLHPWGGLAATRDSMLTVLDCFLDGTPLEVLQNVFESARARERERELLYPDACGGGGRGWMSQNGRGHGMKETCALHTARLSCEALVDFWSALGVETRRSLLRMKEEDFIERLTFRFDSKRFCRDCRRNVLREFKEMKELKRTRREPRCTPWFCAADTVFQYEVSDTVVQADWRESFAGEIGTIYQHFEWGLGTGEGKADIFGFEDVGLAENIMLGGLDLANYPDCFITIRAWRRDGRCTELSAKAHGLKGQLCVHRRLFVGDGLVSITEGESIERFFEHAEETEEEEDEEAMDKDGNELESGTSRTQKHAKSPELARDFLLDAATVIFKEQVEKAFREGTARQNAHSIFVCLALGLLEDRVRVACKEIATLEKQNKLLEEEEYQKREEEERRERKKLKEREKKLRRKEKRNKDKEKERVKGDGKTAEDLANAWTDSSAVSSILDDPQASCGNHIMEDEHPCVQMEDSCKNDDSLSARSSTTGFDSEVNAVEGTMTPSASSAEDDASNKDVSGTFLIEQSKSAKRRSQSKRLQADPFPSRHSRRGSNMAYERSFRRSSTRVIPNHYSESSWQEPNLQCHRNCRILRDGNSRLPDNRHRLNCHSQLRHDSQQCSCPQVLSRTKNVQNTVFKPARDCNPKIIKRTANGDSCVKQYFVVSSSNYKGDFYRGKKGPAFGPEKHPHMKAKGDLSSPSPRINPKLVSCNQDAGHSIDMEDSAESNASTCIARSNCVTGNVREDIAKEDIGECIEQNGHIASVDNLPLELNRAGVTVSSSGDASSNASLVEDCLSFIGSPESSFRSSISEDLECVSSVQESVVSSIHASRPGSPAMELSSCSSVMADAQCVEEDGRNDAKNPAAMTEKVERMEGIPPGRVQDSATYPQLVHDTFSDFPQGIESGYSVPTQPQLSHTANASPVHSLPLQFPQPSYGCYSWTAQPRANIIIPPQIFIPGPSSMAFPRYGMLPLPPVVRPLPSLSNAVTSLHIREPMPLPFSKVTQWKSSADAQPFVSSGASTASLQPASIRTDSQATPLSMPDRTDFSLFHFGGPRSTVLTQSGYLPSLPDGTESAGSCSSDLSKCKCADELPSGINAMSTSAGEYSLFAAAPGKGFGFF